MAESIFEGPVRIFAVDAFVDMQSWLALTYGRC